jgi:hypothetical protein
MSLSTLQQDSVSEQVKVKALQETGAVFAKQNV